MRKKKTTEDFIIESKKIHGDKYYYPDEYINSKNKINIGCYEHGLFSQRPVNHICGQGCPKCGVKTNSNTEDFNIKSKKIHGDKYYYPNEYINNKTHILIGCYKHGLFSQRPNDHLNGEGCKECKLEKKPNLISFIGEAKKIHGDIYDYSNISFINNYTKVDINCSIHGFFKQRPNDHMSGNGCPVCRESKGEREIRLFLEKKNIKYIKQYKFPDCKDKNTLPFDFYLPDHNTCIEFNGIQHYVFSKFFHRNENGFILQQKRDLIKLNYCYINKINLISVKFDENIIATLSNL